MSALFYLAVGLGIFLYGMYQLESGAKALTGRRLKSWILTSTQSPISSALSGTVLTAILQSSSLVGLVVLAFASAGAIPLINAVGVLLGANLGTTFTGWLVTLVGFKLDLEEFALPIIAVSGMSQIFSAQTSRLRAVGQVGLGLGLLLFGLSTMKDSVAELPNAVSFSTVQGYRPIVYLLLGAVVTAIIQSSSAMMILTLTALHAGLVALPEAAALVIGADLGTTSTVLLGSLTGGVVKRQLALAHLLFNVIVDVTAFFLFLPLLPAAFAFIELKDPLYGLVAFHSFFNLAGLIAFLPFIGLFTHWIQRLVKMPDHEISPLSKLPIPVPETAMPLLQQALLQLWGRAILTNARHFSIRLDHLSIDVETKNQLHLGSFLQRPFQENYAIIKESEDEILRFIAKAQQLPLTQEQTEDLARVVEITRAIVYSCKTLKDIVANLYTLKSDEDEHIQQQFQNQRSYHLNLYSRILNLVYCRHPKEYLGEEAEQLYHSNDLHQQVMDKNIYQAAGRNRDDPGFTSTQLNVNREVHHAAKNLLNGLKAWIQLQD